VFSTCSLRFDHTLLKISTEMSNSLAGV